jgi:hypothetical protein
MALPTQKDNTMYLSNIHVFPLVQMDSMLNGYFMDANGSVYSNKSPRGVGVLTKLSGTRQPSGHYYTLNKRTFRADDLIRRAKAHKSFIFETKVPISSTAIGAAVDGVVCMGRTKSAERAVAVKGYVIATIGPTDRFVFGTDPVLHVGESTVREEASRIAALKPGIEVVILKVHASVVSGGVTWK